MLSGFFLPLGVAEMCVVFPRQVFLAQVAKYCFKYLFAWVLQVLLLEGLEIRHVWCLGRSQGGGGVRGASFI